MTNSSSLYLLWSYWSKIPNFCQRLFIPLCCNSKEVLQTQKIRSRRQYTWKGIEEEMMRNKGNIQMPILKEKKNAEYAWRQIVGLSCRTATTPCAWNVTVNGISSLPPSSLSVWVPDNLKLSYGFFMWFYELLYPVITDLDCSSTKPFKFRTIGGCVFASPYICTESIMTGLL